MNDAVNRDLWPGRSYRLGRQPDAEIRLPHPYDMVSRYHAIVEPRADEKGWQVRDLGSANGTFVNDLRLDVTHQLRSGDVLQLGRTGPRFVFEALETAAAEQQTLSQAQTAASTPETMVTLTQLFPLISTGDQLGDNPVFLLGLLTIAIGISLFVGFGNPIVFNSLLALYLSLFLYYIFIYQLCGKPKSWLLLAAMAGATILLLNSPLLQGWLWLFREVLPGEALPFTWDTSETHTALNLIQIISRTFWGTGLMEEIFKALPVLTWVGITHRLPKGWRSQWGIVDPLDGILLCTASALGFTLLETLGQYVPQVTQQITGTASADAGQLAGLQLLIPRLLGSIAGHLAYSGYFGYFIGLICLRSYSPLQRLGLLVLGCLSAAILHTFWNVAGLLSPILLALSGILSYSLLMAAILKARTL